MAGEEDLTKLLSGMSPVLIPGEYVFCSFKAAQYGDRSDLEPVAAIREREGLTLVIPRARADASEVAYESVFRCITLGVHSSLDAVGLTAALASALAAVGIGANVVAGFFHDHVFVKSEQADAAVTALRKWSHQKL